MTVCPSAAVSGSASRRAIVSLAAPGPKTATRVIGLLWNFSAPWAGPNNATPATTTAASNFFMRGVLGRDFLCALFERTLKIADLRNNCIAVHQRTDSHPDELAGLMLNRGRKNHD